MLFNKANKNRVREQIKERTIFDIGRTTGRIDEAEINKTVKEEMKKLGFKI